MKPKALLSLALAVFLIPTALDAEEGGSGHYLPGTAASNFDSLPGKPAWAVFDFFTYYDGDAGVNRPLNIAGTVAAGVKATLFANTVGTIYQSKLTLLGGSYCAGLAIPTCG